MYISSISHNEDDQCVNTCSYTPMALVKVFHCAMMTPFILHCFYFPFNNFACVSYSYMEKWLYAQEHNEQCYVNKYDEGVGNIATLCTKLS